MSSTARSFLKVAAWTPKVGRMMAQYLQKERKRLLFCLLSGSRYCFVYFRGPGTAPLWAEDSEDAQATLLADVFVGGKADHGAGS